MEGEYSWINIINLSKPVACRLRARNGLLHQVRVIENVTYFRHVCEYLLVVGWLTSAVLTLWKGQTGRGCRGESNATFSEYFEDERRKCLPNFGIPVPDYTGSQTVRVWYWYSPLWSYEGFASLNTVCSNISNQPSFCDAVCSRRRCVLQLCPTYRRFNPC
jgi:hypothetical protein